MNSIENGADPSISKLNSSTRVLLTTVVHKLLPSLTTGLENPDRDPLSWTDTLNHYAVAAKQLDHLWQEIQPAGDGLASDAGFDLTIVTPIDSGHPNVEQIEQQRRTVDKNRANNMKQEPVFMGVCVPDLLSTMIPEEDVAHVNAAGDQWNYCMPTLADEQALLEHIRTHNQGVGDLIDSLNNRLEQWRSEKDKDS